MSKAWKLSSFGRIKTLIYVSSHEKWTSIMGHIRNLMGKNSDPVPQWSPNNKLSWKILHYYYLLYTLDKSSHNTSGQQFPLNTKTMFLSTTTPTCPVYNAYSIRTTNPLSLNVNKLRYTCYPCVIKRIKKKPQTRSSIKKKTFASVFIV